MKTIKTLLLLLVISPSFAQKQQKEMKHILSDYSFPTKTVKIDSLDISYQRAGKGDKTILFLHGLSSNSDAWAKNIEILQQSYDCIAIDLPGFGKSSIPTADYTPTFFAAVVFKFLKELEIDKVVLVGHSMGGQASIKFANQHPEIVHELILVAPAGIEKFSEMESQMIKNIYNLDLIKNTSEDQIKKNFELNFFKMPEDVSKMINDRINIKNSSDFDLHCEAIVNSVSGMLKDSVFDDLSNLTPRTLIIFGENDMLIPNRYLHSTLSVKKIGETAKDLITNSQLNFIEESGHFVQFEKPKEVNQAIKMFLEQE